MKIKTAADIAGALLGLAFITFGLNFFLHFLPDKPLPDRTAARVFLEIMYATPYLVFVKVLEVFGGVLVAIPKTRNAGLLILGPIIVNIICFNAFLPGARDLASPQVIGIALLALFLVWTQRKAFAALLNNDTRPGPG